LGPFSGSSNVFVCVEIGSARKGNEVNFSVHYRVAGTNDRLDVGLFVQFKELNFFIVEPDNVGLVCLEFDVVGLVNG